jgi:hemerythrin
MKFIWRDIYSVKIKEFDDQHKQFFNIINKIDNYRNDVAVSRAKIIEVLTELNDYGLYHMSSEERYFDKYKYSQSAAHKQSHKMFEEKVEILIKEAKEDEVRFRDMAMKIAEFCKNWLSKHIISVDKLYTEELLNKITPNR